MQDVRALCIVASVLLAPVLLQAQQSRPADNGSADQSSLTLKQEVRNVIVDVVAVDKHGDPVKSLDKAHFQLTENGIPQDISFFEEHQAESQAPASGAPPPALPPGVYTNVEPVSSGQALVVLLLDALNTPIGSQAYVRSQMMDYLKQLPAGTHMAIFTLGNRLQLIQGFTSNPAVLKAALDGKAYPEIPALATGSSGLSDAGGNAEGLRMGGVAVPFASSVSTTRNSLNHFANETDSFDNELRIRLTLDALNAMAVYLDGIPGRKNLVWFCSSIPWTINPDFSLVTGVTGRVDYSQELKKLADVMTLGRVSVYPIDAQGLLTPPGFAADRGGSGFGTRGSGAAFGTQEMNAQMNLAGNHMSMSNLAAATGGQALYNTNGLAEAVAKVGTMGENYYTIAYSPKDKTYDGSFRALKVTVTDPAVKLEYRRGYYADDPQKTTGRSGLMYSNALHAVMLRGAPDATQIPFRVQAAIADRQPAQTTDRVGDQGAKLKGPVTRYDFHWVVDASKVQFAAEANGVEHGEVDATLTAYDVDGNVLNSIFSRLPLNVSAATYDRLLKSGLPMKQTLDLPAGVVYMRVGVLDSTTNRAGATEFVMQVRPGKTDAASAGPAAR